MMTETEIGLLDVPSAARYWYNSETTGLKTPSLIYQWCHSQAYTQWASLDHNSPLDR